MSRLRIATRGSALALAQSGEVAARIAAALDRETELVVVRTAGDRIQDRSLARIGGKGLFIKEIEEALLAGRADVAVHSAKDLPAAIADGCALAAFPERADPRDALVGLAPDARVATLRDGARVGTGSVRRSSQLLAIRPDLEIVPLRGNVDTRLRKLEDEALDAVILACAGLDRLGRGDVIRERISPGTLLPAVAQGTLALETRADDPVREAVAALDDGRVSAAIAAERAFLGRLEGDCSVPLAAFAEIADGRLRLRGLVASPDGGVVVRAERSGAVADAADVGTALADEVLAKAGAEVLAALGATA